MEKAKISVIQGDICCIELNVKTQDKEIMHCLCLWNQLLDVPGSNIGSNMEESCISVQPNGKFTFGDKSKKFNPFAVPQM